MVTFLVTLAAGLGAVARYLVDETVQRRTPRTTARPFPTGTFSVNITGSFLVGLVVGLTTHHGLHTSASTVLTAGFLGGYTTLSTWAWESFALAEQSVRIQAVINVVGSLGLGMLAGAAGLGLAMIG